MVQHLREKSATTNSLKKIEKLTHLIASLAHSEALCLENRLAIRLLAQAKQPLDNELRECKRKTDMFNQAQINLESWSLQWFFLKITCGLEEEKARVNKTLKKAKESLCIAQANVDTENENIEAQVERNKGEEENYELLVLSRRDLEELLDSATSETETTTFSEKETINTLKEAMEELGRKKRKIQTVRDLLVEAGDAVLEALVELHYSNKEDSIGKGLVYFPDKAYIALKEARIACPELPEIKRPENYEEKTNDSGLRETPMQSYLRDVSNSLKGLVRWCDDQETENLRQETDLMIALGKEMDEWNMERRSIIRQSAGSINSTVGEYPQ